MISEVHKNNMCAYLLHNLLLSFANLNLIQTVMFNRYHDVRPNTLRISPPKLPCPGTAPVAVISLKFPGNMPRFVLGKVRKFQDLSSSRLGDI